MDQDKKSPEYNFFDDIEDLSIRFLWNHTKWHQEEPYVICKDHNLQKVGSNHPLH